MICPNCKNEIKDNEKACKKCGAIVGIQKNKNNPDFEGVHIDKYTVHLDDKPSDKNNNVNPKALASSIISIMSLFLLGFISIIGIMFGIIALKEIKTNNPKDLNGKKLAIIGIVIGLISLILYAILFLIR